MMMMIIIIMMIYGTNGSISHIHIHTHTHTDKIIRRKNIQNTMDGGERIRAYSVKNTVRIRDNFIKRLVINIITQLLKHRQMHCVIGSV